MVNFLLGLLDIMIAIFMWGSVICAAGLLIYKIYTIVKGKATTKDYIILIISALYLALYFGSLFCFGLENFKFFFAVLFMIFAIISTQLQKYEDRKAGRRWWEN